VGKDPLIYVHGSQQIIPGLENALEGMAVGEQKQVKLEAEEGYGPVQEQAVVEVPMEQLPEDARTVGTMVQGQGPSGQPVRGRVADMKEETAVIDFNHPLAGKTLFFDVKVLDIQ
jgi:FKBP-type peptidyl-prolyl cis-trans isomerase SlyD